MVKSTRKRIKSDLIIKQIKRPIFSQTSIIGRSRMVDTIGDVWEIGEIVPAALNWDLLPDLPPLLLSQLKYYFESLISKMAPDTVIRHFSALKRLFRSIDDFDQSERLKEQLSESLLDYIFTHRDPSDEGDLSVLRAWYRDSYHLGLTLFSRNTAQLLKRFRFRGNIKGIDVMTYIENRSPLHSDELIALRSALAECRDYVTPSDPMFKKLVVTWLYVVLGVRPRQILLLMTCDFAVNVNTSTGEKSFMLNVPSVKKRFTGIRERFKPRFIPIFLGELLELLIAEQYRGLANKEELQNSDALPIFRKSAGNVRKERGSTFERFQDTASDRLFNSAPSEVVDFINQYRIKEGKPQLLLKLYPRRLRKTFATHAAAMGASAITLMELLDHDDLQHVMIYYQLGVSFAIKADAVYTQHFKEYISFFEGKITLAELVNRNDVKTVFGPDSLRKLVGIGLCAKQDPCNLQPPYSCYSCKKFEASNDVSVHREVFNAMQAEIREKFGDETPPGFYTATHIKACGELIERLEVDHE